MVCHKRTCCDYNVFKTLLHVWSVVLRNLTTFRHLSSLFTGFPLCFKLLCIVFRVLRGVGPLYLQELICPYRPTRSLRSESKNFLYVLVFHTATYGNTLFTGETVILWNDLPQEVRDAENLSSFKRLLKTHFLFLPFLQIVVQHVLSVF